MSLELDRRLVHASGSVVPGADLVGLLTWDQVRVLLAAGIIVALVLEGLRLLVGVDVPYIDRLTRPYEEEYVAGYALYVIAGGAVGLVFEPTIAVPAILMLTLGDPVAGLFSTGELRRIKRPRVLAAMFVLSLAIAWWFLDPLAAVAAAGVATVADGVKPVIKGYVIDDNLTIPIGAALAAFLVLEYGTSIV